ncbi:MAG: hypothetical protein KC503_21225 [Myxococcales bacterium]|nr:hypothetical protein [Myxococcales bacterium]
MPRFIPILLTLALLMGCNSGDGDPVDAGPPDTGPRPYGGECTDDKDCESNMCIEGFCSKLCAAQTDCKSLRVDPDPNKPKGSLGGPCRDNGSCAKGLECYSGECLRDFQCGKTAKDDQVACFARKYDDQPFTTGYDCSADGRCANGWKCIGTAGSRNRFCSPNCESDTECPPQFRCTEYAPSEAIKDWEKKKDKRCMPRRIGHPCEIDDQCFSEIAGVAHNFCVKDTKGNGYCTTECKANEPGTCPPFMKCEDAGNNKLRCRFKAAQAYPAAGAGKRCEPCISHGQQERDVLYFDIGQCAPGGLCFELSPYSRESVCLEPCPSDGMCPNADDRCTIADPKVCVPTKIDPDTQSRVIGSCYP